MTRADLTTCGRNILPAPNRSPTTFMPSIRGPSMTASGLPDSTRAASVSSTMNSSIPLTSACSSRFSTGQERHALSSARRVAVSPRNRAAISSRRSVESGRRARITSSTRSRSSASMSSRIASCPALTIPMLIPARMAWYRNAECIASRTTSLPRNENETLLRPPLTCTCGQAARIFAVASMKSRAYRSCCSMPVATAKMFGSKMMSSGGKPTSSTRRR